jgi:hypothetical protein
MQLCNAINNISTRRVMTTQRFPGQASSKSNQLSIANTLSKTG